MQGCAEQTEGEGDDVAAIRAALRKQLPAVAFQPDLARLWHVAGYAAIAAASYLVIRGTDRIWIWGIAALVLGACHLSVGFIAHDLSHGAIVRNRRWRTLIESGLWALTVTPAVVWIVSHNRVHHPHTGSAADCFRYFTQSERSRVRTWFSLCFMPNRRLRWNPLVFQIFLVEMTLHAVAALWYAGRHAGAVGPIPRLGVYSARDRLRLIAEIGLVAVVQAGIYVAVGADWARYLAAGPVAFLLASAGASAYLYTQHALHDVSLHADPFSSTSVRVPAVIDWLHSYHAHHTAHHLFPVLRCAYYPRVTAMLLRDHPGRMQQLGFGACLARAFDNPTYKADPVRG